MRIGKIEAITVAVPLRKVFSGGYDPLWSEMIRNGSMIENGVIEVSEAPSAALEFDWDLIPRSPRDH